MKEIEESTFFIGSFSQNGALNIARYQSFKVSRFLSTKVSGIELFLVFMNKVFEVSRFQDLQLYFFQVLKFLGIKVSKFRCFQVSKNKIFEVSMFKGLRF
jgi:hypothetical protein